MRPPFHQAPSFLIIKYLIYLKILVLMLTTFIFWGFQGSLSGLSAALGGGISLSSEMVFILVSFRHSYARAARKVVQGFFWGEALKWLVTMILFTVSFQWSKLKALPLFVGFMATKLTFWLVPLIYDKCIRIHTAPFRSSHATDKLWDV